MQAIKGPGDQSMYKNMLPRTLSFIEVLRSVPEEMEYTVTDTQVDDFYMFRYEIHSMMNKHLYVDEDEKKTNELFLLGKRPLSKVQGVPVKDMIKNLQQRERQDAEKYKIGKDRLQTE
jgi:hypothetical protein